MNDDFLAGAPITNANKPPFFMIDNRLYDDGVMAKMGPYSFMVYAVLVRRADQHGACFPSQKRIADDLGISRDSVTKAVARLEQLTIIRREERHDDSGKRTSDRIILLPQGVPSRGTPSAHTGVPLRLDIPRIGIPNRQEEDPEEQDPVKRDVPLLTSPLGRESETPVNVPWDDDPETQSVEETPKPKRARTKRPLTFWPDGLALTDDFRAVAVKAGIRPDRIDAVWEAFRNHAEAKASRYASWPAAWRTWVGSHYQDHDRSPAATTLPPGAEPPADDLEGRIRWIETSTDRRYFGSDGLDRRRSEIAEIRRKLGGQSDG